MGNIMSPEGKKIFAGDRGKGKLNEFNNVGEGYLIIDKEGADIERVKFEKITDFDAVYKEIKKAMKEQKEQ